MKNGMGQSWALGGMEVDCFQARHDFTRRHWILACLQRREVIGARGMRVAMKQ